MKYSGSLWTSLGRSYAMTQPLPFTTSFRLDSGNVNQL